jgi:5-bromo-4-chloroindolyl phosphate hydrolysis protein
MDEIKRRIELKKQHIKIIRTEIRELKEKLKAVRK